jgi:hypothetical protein
VALAAEKQIPLFGRNDNSYRIAGIGEVWTPLALCPFPRGILIFLL